MMKKIHVQGILYVEEDDIDTGPNGPLTEEAFNEYAADIPLDDIEFSLVES